MSQHQLNEILEFQTWFLARKAMQTIRFILDVPPSANKRLKPFISKSGKMQASFYQSKESKDYQEATAWIAHSAMKLSKVARMKNHCKVCIIWHKAKNMGDVQDRFKDVYDALNDVLWDDDKQVKEVHLFEHYDKLTTPRLDVIIKEVAVTI